MNRSGTKLCVFKAKDLFISVVLFPETYQFLIHNKVPFLEYVLQKWNPTHMPENILYYPIPK